MFQVLKKYKDAVINNLSYLKKERKGEERNVKEGYATVKEMEETFKYIGVDLTNK